MRVLSRSALAVVAMAVGAACGGGDGDGPEGPNGSANMTAQVDGEEWRGMANAARSAGGVYTITGADGTDGLSIQLYNIPSTGTYPLGINATGFGGTGIVSQPGAGWGTPLDGLSGSITITTLTDTRIVGTFHYTATPLNGSAVGTKDVTDGEFDLLMQTAGAWTPPDPWDGSSLNGRFGTDTIVGATIAVVLTGDDLLFTAGNLTHVMSLTLQDLGAAGSYAYADAPPVRRLSLTDVNGSAIYLTDVTSPGSVVITTVNANRVAGTYTATLKRLASAETITVSGAFDVGIPHF